MSVALTAVGVALVGLVLRDVFHTIFHPSGRGQLSMHVFRSVWKLSGKTGRRARALSGALSMVLVIALWVAASVVGFALIYWPALPAGFIFASQLDAHAQDGFIDALYFSWVTQATLGFGDVAPREGVLRVLAPLQATIGFALFTVAVSWVLSVYPALQRRRAAASAARSIRDSHRQVGAAPGDLAAVTLARQMERMAEMVAAVRVDFMQYPSTFYFAAPATSVSLGEALPYVASLVRRDDMPLEAKLAAAELASALELLSGDLAEQFFAIGDTDTGNVLEAYGRHDTPRPGDNA